MRMKIKIILEMKKNKNYQRRNLNNKKQCLKEYPKESLLSNCWIIYRRILKREVLMHILNLKNYKQEQIMMKKGKKFMIKKRNKRKQKKVMKIHQKTLIKSYRNGLETISIKEIINFQKCMKYHNIQIRLIRLTFLNRNKKKRKYKNRKFNKNFKKAKR